MKNAQFEVGPGDILVFGFIMMIGWLFFGSSGFRIGVLLSFMLLVFGLYLMWRDGE